MIPYQLVWLILLLPLLSFVVISLFIRPFVKTGSRIAGYIAITAIGASFALSVWTLFSVMGSEHHMLPVSDVTWLVIENGITIHAGQMVDQLTAIMLVAVTLVSLMVQIYSQGYMHGDSGYHRYYGWMSLFTFSMLGLVTANNLLFLFVFWEMVGLCSYLLIGFWFHRPSAANAAKKAFIVTRIGDFGFLAGILILYFNTGTLDISELHGLAVSGVLAGTTLTWAAIGIFAGAVGKSAQFPLHVWLPDAMEGPTPVSALIHSATMVSAGVFLVARTFPLFVNSLEAVTTVAIVGGVTAIFAASMGLVMYDIKRVLAYSTISQLGYMMLGLGAAGVALSHGSHTTLEVAKAGVTIGMFHLFNHAFFKALLFLGSGSVNHATGTFDMRLMGGLRKVMPWTFITFVIGSLSLAGIWPLAGFWSKDEILAISMESQPVMFWLAMITVFMTAFYMFRAVFMTFGGEYRGGSGESHGGHDTSHPHESSKVMVIPLVILAVMAVITGFWNTAGGFNEFMGHGGGEAAHSFWGGLFGVFTHTIDGIPLPLISLIVALVGIFMAYVIYSAKWISAESIGKIFGPMHNIISRKYFFDELYENVIVKTLLMKWLFGLFRLFDTGIVDGIVNGVAGGVRAGGKTIRHAQTGQLQLYALFIGIGILVIILSMFIFG